MARAPRPGNPFLAILQEATQRLFLSHVSLEHALRDDPARTLYVISAEPHTLGELRPCDGTVRQQRLSNLLTAAKAFLSAERKHRTHASHQPELPLDKRNP